MEALLTWLLSVQLAFGPLLSAAELLRCCSSPPRVVDLSQARVLVVTDQISGESFRITEMPEPPADPAAVVVFDCTCQVLLAPTGILAQACPPVDQAAQEIMEDYTSWFELPEILILDDLDQAKGTGVNWGRVRIDPRPLCCFPNAK